MVAGIIAEFNPFHSAHKYLIDCARQDGADTVVCVMSGYFVQRGEGAIFTKWARAEAALKCGADIIIELPVRYSMSTAMKFALGGVKLLDSINVDCIYFGSECGDEKLIKEVADKVLESDGEILRFLKEGMSYAAAREAAVGSDILSNPNDTLAVEYINAIKQINSKMNYKAVKRIGANHDSLKKGEFCSAGYLRNNLNELKEYVPDDAYKIFKKQIDDGFVYDYSKAKLPVMIKLRSMTKQEIYALPDISEGLGDRLYNAIRVSKDYEELISNTKSKRYTEARVRRILMSALLLIEKSEITDLPKYIKVLGFNKNAECLFKNAKLPVIIRANEKKSLDKSSIQEYNLECRADDIYALLLKKSLPCGATMTQPVIKE